MLARRLESVERTVFEERELDWGGVKKERNRRPFVIGDRSKYSN